MPMEELKGQLLEPVSDFWRDKVAGWLDSVDERFLKTLEADDWWPGVDDCLKAFDGTVCPRVVWLGETPYEGEERATGLSFLDGTVCDIFRVDGALDMTVNKASSLRNILKAWFRADGRLQENQTNSEHVHAMCKDGLVLKINEVFRRGVEDGWLWLNAGLSVGGPLAKSTHLCGWRPFVSRAVASAAQANAKVVLLGDWAKSYRSDVADERLLVETIHPRNECFVEDATMREFLGQWTCLIHQ